MVFKMGGDPLTLYLKPPRGNPPAAGHRGAPAGWTEVEKTSQLATKGAESGGLDSGGEVRGGGRRIAFAQRWRCYIGHVAAPRSGSRGSTGLPSIGLTFLEALVRSKTPG